MTDNKRLNEVIRVVKRPSNFVMIDKAFLEDTRLSYKAKGMLAYLLSKPDNWKVIVTNLVNNSTDGKASIYAGLKELKDCGYYEKKPIRNEDGTRIMRWESTVYEVPISLLTDFQDIENLDIENLFIENREHNNNYITKELDINNNHVKSSQTMTDVEKKIKAYKELIKDNISYADLLITNPYDTSLIDEFVDIILDMLITRTDTIRIGGENKPRELVQSALMKLTQANIELVLEQYKEHGERIKKKRQYILTMLYNSTMELNSHYSNWVRSDMARGGEQN